MSASLTRGTRKVAFQHTLTMRWIPLAEERMEGGGGGSSTFQVKGLP